MTFLRSRRLIRSLSMLAAASAALAVPTSAMAAATSLLAGAESNGELANSSRTPELQAIALDKMQAQGVKVVRVNFAWNEIATGADCGTQSLVQLKDHTNACYNWGLLDSLVKLTTERRQQLLISLTRVPLFVSKVADPYWVGSTVPQFNNVTAHYAAFMSAAGTRYKTGSAFGTIPYWTIWNEPGSKTFWKPTPNAQRYAYMYGKAAVALKTVHPRAIVAPGPTGPKSTINPVAFIRTFLKWAPKYLPGRTVTLKRKYINAWAHNPYPGVTSQPSVAGRNTPATTIGMASINKLFVELDKSPLTKGVNVWATEFGWETPPERAQFVSYALQAQFMAEAYDWLDSKKRVTIGIWYGLTDPIEAGDFQTGTYTAAGAIKPSMRMYQRMVSVAAGGKFGKVKRGTTVRIWGRSNINARKGVLAFKLPGGKWTTVPGQKRRATDGSIVANVKVTAKVVQFSVYDATVAFTGDTGYGPARTIKTF